MLVGALAVCVAVGVLTLVEFKGVKSVVQAGVAATAVWCVCRYPVSAIPIYLLGFYLPCQVLRGSAPLPYPEFVLPISFCAAALLRSHSGLAIPRAAKSVLALLLALSILASASSLWGNSWISLNIVLGFAFVLASFAILRTEREFWINCAILAAVELAAGVWFCYAGRNIVQDDTFRQAAVIEQLGNTNYASFHLGLAIVICWCAAMGGCSGAIVAKWRALSVRGFALLCAAVGLWMAVRLQSRGVSLAIAGGVIASLIHSRLKLKRVILAGLLAGTLMAAASQTAAFDAFMEQWRNKEEIASGDRRFALWKTSLQQYEESPLITQIFGFGCGTELKRTHYTGSFRPSQVSTHNSFIRFLLDQGMVGAALFTLALAFCAHHAWHRKDEVGNLRFSMVVFLVIDCLSMEPHESTVFWLALGLCLPLELSSVVVPATNRSARSQPRPVAPAWMAHAGLKYAARIPFQGMRRPPHPRITSVGFKRIRWHLTRVGRRFIRPRPLR